LVFRERDDESNFGGEVPWGSVQETDDSCRGGVGLEDLVVRGIDDKALVWLDPPCEDGSEESLLGVERTEGDVLVDFRMVFGVVPVPVTVDRWLYAWSMGCAYDVSGVGGVSPGFL